MAKKYYTTANCNRLIEVDGEPIPFEPYIMLAGVWYGLYETEDKAEQESLGEQGNIHEISKEEYEEELKKKANLSTEFNPLQIHSSAKANQAGPTLVEDVGPVQSVLQQQSKEAEKAAEAEKMSLDTALQVGPTDKATKTKGGRRKK